ncbi:phasin family protein [Belnapia sp. T18]|uniref:Phasin family protein n=1 Tax=Belnapia arida TaxID=2804533 RepID=A0ABS1TWB5_9PROT|nr:phasin family protein [Belnapia arida]MBL6076744.1 phasin family protein [Belnapia arida]
MQPLVPEPPDLLALQRHGIEMMAAANRLALGWLRTAAEQQAAVTRRTFEEMSAAARRVAAADAGSAQAEAMVAMLEQARRLGLETAEELAQLMQRVQGEALDLMDRALGAREE